MIRLFLTVALLTFISTCSQASDSKDSVRVESMLATSRLLREGENAMLFFGKKLLDVPYVAHTLDRDKEEHLVINTTQLDCTTFVENVVALTLCHQRSLNSFADYRSILQKIRYRDGIVSYVNRLHYFTEWINDNERKGFVTKVENDKAPFTAVQHLNVNYMSKHVQSYAMLLNHPEWLPSIKQTEKDLTGRSYRYIPKSAITNSSLMRKTIHDGDIIAILTSKVGLDTSHIGIAVWKSDGLHLLNASQIHKKVVIEPMTLQVYMKRHPSQIGIRICRLNDFM